MCAIFREMQTVLWELAQYGPNVCDIFAYGWKYLYKAITFE